MLKTRFFRATSKGISYNEKYYGSKASFNSYIEGFEKFKLEEDSKLENAEEEIIPIPSKVIEKPPPTKVGRRALQTLSELSKGNNLEKFLESHGMSLASSGVSLPQLKEALEKLFVSEKMSEKKKEILKWEQLLDNLRELTDEKKLEKWLESSGVPASKVNLPKVKKELEKYFQNYKTEKEIPPILEEPNWGKRSEVEVKNVKNKKLKSQKPISASAENLHFERDCEDFPNKTVFVKTYSEEFTLAAESISFGSEKKIGRDFGACMRVEDFKGRSMIYQENTLAHKLWEDFKGMGATKQVTVIVGITVVSAALGFVSWQLLFLTFPSAFSANRYWSEVLAEWFMRRQDSSLNLLQHTAENVKPLSTAWANQYLLWKYI